MKGDAFACYHPAVNFLYFALILAFSMLIMHPVCLFTSLFWAVSYAVLLKGPGILQRGILYFLPIMLLAVLFNAVFSHRGVTILGYLPGGNPFTLESLLYGTAAAVMLATALCWFFCYNTVMTSDKYIFLFGRIAPFFSLLLSMILRILPKLRTQLKLISNAQRFIGQDMDSGGIMRRARSGVRILSILVTWSLENAIETADSMKSRGYGLPGRTSFSLFRFVGRDARLLFCIACAGAYILIGTVTRGLTWRYYPSVKFGAFTPYSVSILSVYFLLCAAPVIIQILEGRKWTVSF